MLIERISKLEHLFKNLKFGIINSASDYENKLEILIDVRIKLV